MSARSFDINKTKKQSNIKVMRGDGIITVLLHGHPVVVINGTEVKISSCGYKTVTTKTAINRALEQLGITLRVRQAKGIWYFGQLVFEDDMLITLK